MKQKSLIKRAVGGIATKFFNSVVSGVGGNGWLPWIREPYSGAWQEGKPISMDTALSHYAVYACITRIASDTAKLKFILKKKQQSNIYLKHDSPAFSPVLRKPNRYQNHIQFKEHWITSKLCRGNTYVLKVRDNRGVVVEMFILDPDRVTPLVTSDGGVYYQLADDNLNNPLGNTIVPASEIIHDRMNCLFHPLVGISPLYASSLAASNGLEIQKDSKNFFANSARPSGILTAPGQISDAVATRLKESWTTNFTGDKASSVAVLGDDLRFEPMRVTAVDSQTIEQLGMTAEIVCTTFQVPKFKVGIGTLPTGTKVEDLNQIYYSDCLQKHFEDMETCLDEGLNIPHDSMKIELDLDGLLRMDNTALYKMLGQAIKDTLLTPDEARHRINHESVAGGNTIYMQQQNYSLAALSKRDAKDDPFEKTSGKTNSSSNEESNENDEDEDFESNAKLLALFLNKEFQENEH